MGKAQSKRSVDITTETKKVAEDEITEKMEKIEDVDKKEVLNGDATISEKSDHEKKDTEEVENDKDMTTEKDIDAQASGNSAEAQNTAETSKEEGGGLATAEEISPLADESIKKSKKEKVKKKWSFRSISFGKKDKQKPAKTEDATEDGSEITNGADTEEKSTTETEDSPKDKIVNENDEKTTESHENGNATPQELKGEENEEKASEEKSNDITANTTNNTTTTETCEPVQSETTVVSSEISEKTENTVITTSIINENQISENATVDDATKNGNGVDEKVITTEQTLQQNQVTNTSVEAPSEKTSTMANDVTNELSASTNGEVLDKIHQNGDHGASDHDVEKSKEQNEVNINNDNNVSAATLDYISSTSINPSNVQIHVQEFNTSSEKPDETNQINKNECDIQTCTDIEVNIHTDAQSSISEAVSMKDDLGNIVTVDNIGSETASDNEKLTEDKVGVEPSPPPLPISPPPSQVSVFAFTNNESAEGSIQTKNFEPTINKLVEEEVETSSPPQECGLSKTEIHNSNEKIDEETINDNPTQQIHVDEIKENVETECPEIEEDFSMHKDELSTFNESQNEEESSVAVATAVIDEITEKAAAIVNEQLNCNNEKIIDGQSLPSKSQEEDEKDNGVINESTFVEFDNKNQNDNEEFVSGTTSCSKDNSVVIEQTNNIATDCSLDFSTPNSLLEDQDQMISLNKSDNIDEEHLNPTKEIANAKDIKDNATVAEITQDLSVTCE